MGINPVFAPVTLDRKSWPPNYIDVFAWRQGQLILMGKKPELMASALAYYSTRPSEWINHWVDTFDPRNALTPGLPTRLPLILFERQDEMVQFLWSCLQDESNGLIDKSRDMGATWVAAAFSVWLWLFVPGSSVGWGSRKQDLVDKLGDPDSIFEKMRMIIRGLPLFMWPRGFNMDTNATFMRLVNPENSSTITGEAGDNIGRGGRKTIYFKDESAHYEHPESIEAALGDNTRVQIDISTTSGVGTVYDRKKEAGVEWSPGDKTPRGIVRVFTMDWSDHPAKNQAWHDTRETEARNNGLLHLFRQEVDRDASSALVGIIIKPEWIKAAVDAHIDLKLDTTGGWCAGFDPYDEGGDQHALSIRKGIVLLYANDWGEGDTGQATRFVCGEMLGRTPVAIQYDCIGIGAGVKSEANRLKTERLLPLGVTFHPWDAGNPPVNPKQFVIPGDSKSPRIEDFYKNLKAQAWWEVARRFENVYRMRTEGIKFPNDKLISLSSTIPKLRQLMRELSQPVMKKSVDLKLLVDKKPEGARSPNMADAIIMNYFPVSVPMKISAEAVAASLQGAR